MWTHLIFGHDLSPSVANNALKDVNIEGGNMEDTKTLEKPAEMFDRVAETLERLDSRLTAVENKDLTPSTSESSKKTKK